MAKKAIKKNETAANPTAQTNVVTLEGVIYRVLYTTEKVASYVLENTRISPKGNAIKTWLTIKEFKPALFFEKDEHVIIDGEINTDNYKDKDGKDVYNTIVVGTIKGVCADESIPFN